MGVLEDILFLAVGLALILGGASGLVDGAAAVARRYRIRELVIGLTIVAFGTSAPEFVISLMSALKGSPGLALGNVVGSNIFNILMIVGCTALIVPVSMERGTLRIEIPFTLLASLVLFFCAGDMLLDGAESSVVSRADGFILLSFFVIFLAYTFSVARSDSFPEEADNEKKMKMWKAVLRILAGLAGLILGGNMFVTGASGIALRLGVSEATVGLTIVAAGTSLPELATSVVAALKRNPGIAIGNVVGSSLFNIFFVLGLTASICPVKTAGISYVDYAVMILSAVLLLVFGRFWGERKVTRWEGILLIAVYVAYTVYLIL